MIRRVYVAGPYTKGDVAQNVRRAIAAANELMDLGYMPFVPHLTHFWHLIFPRPYKDWMAIDAEWLQFCDAVLRLEGESSGADDEEVMARELGIPIFYDLSSLRGAT